MAKKLNVLMRAEYRRIFEKIPSGVFVDFVGLKSDETYLLRKELHSKKIRMRVLKNSIAKLALEDLGVRGIDKLFVGSVAICSDDDPVAVAKAIVEYRRKNRKTTLAIKGALLERNVLGPEEVLRLAELPGRSELRSIVLGTLAAPIRGLVGATAGILSKLLYALEAVRQKREKGQ